MIGIWLIWEKPNICNKSNISSTIHTGLNNFYISLWSTTINTSQPKLRTYCRFKTDFALENYIQLFKRSTRLNFTKSASPQCKVARARPTEGLVFFSLSSKQTPIQARSQGCGMRRTPPLNLSKGLLLATKAHKVDKMFCFCFCLFLFLFVFFFLQGGWGVRFKKSTLWVQESCWVLNTSDTVTRCLHANILRRSEVFSISAGTLWRNLIPFFLFTLRQQTKFDTYISIVTIWLVFSIFFTQELVVFISKNAEH